MLLKNGTCPGCGSKVIYKKSGGVKGHSSSIFIKTGIFQNAHLDAYVCLGCGHTEVSVPAEDMDELRGAVEKWDWEAVNQQ